MCVVHICWLELLSLARYWGIWKPGSFADEIDNVHAKAVHAFLQPELHDIVNFLYHCWILPVEIRLFPGEKVQVVLARGLIECPSTP